jgi:deazaflavin-dependent oxidoreductase (nitroreductase family)
MPLRAYHHQKGWLLGHTFLLLTHIGRNTGQPYETVALVLRYRPDAREAVICSAWGSKTDWMRNIKAHPATRVEVGREVFAPDQRFLAGDESVTVLEECLRQHPWRFRFMAWVLGWGDLRTEAVAREFVRTRPFVALSPAPTPQAA